MSLTATENPQVLHALPGRLRVHLSGWSGQGKQPVEMRIHQIQGVEQVQATPVTGNVLIAFDPARTNEHTLLERLRGLDLSSIQHPANASPPHAVTKKRRHIVRARVAVRGLDRDPHVAERVTAHLKRQPGVHTVKASALTGRVLIEFDEHEADIDDLVAQVADLELPELPGEDRPAFPLDPGPLIQSSARTIGAVLGFGFLAVRSLLGFAGPLPGAGVALQAASIMGTVEGLPPVRYGLRRLLGRTVADLLLNFPSIISLTLGGSPLGLTMTGAESLRLLTEVRARRSAWRHYEERISHAPSAQPDTEIHLQASERTPLAAQVLEGTGTAQGRDGMPQPVTPGTMLPPGARVYGGPFTLHLHHGESFQAFTPQPRPAPVAPSLFDRYHRILGPVSLAYAALNGLLTLSFSRFLAALLLVNPRTATIGIDSANLGASARVLRAGVTVVGTRPDRVLHRPSLLLLDGTRLLSDGLELCEVVSLDKKGEMQALLAQAAGVASAAGSPWGEVFGVQEKSAATQGHFDGQTATASLDGMRFTLGPVEGRHGVSEARHLSHHGQYVLALTQEGEQQPRGLFALRPRLAEGLSLLVETCQRARIRLAVLPGGDQRAVQALVHRAHLALLKEDDAIGAIRAHQQKGGLVAFVSDQMGASAAFDACDLAIGLSEDRFHLPAPADLLAPDLTAVAIIVDATTRREATVRDAIGFSLLTNLIGILWGFGGMLGIEAALSIVSITGLAAIIDGWWRLRGGKRQAITALQVA
jgi:cation-transporting ATPase I